MTQILCGCLAHTLLWAMICIRCFTQIETCMHARTLHPWTHTHHAHISTNHKDSCLSTTLAEWRSGSRSRLQWKIKTYGHSPSFHWSNKSQNEVNFILAKKQKTKNPNLCIQHNTHWLRRMVLVKHSNLDYSLRFLIKTWNEMKLSLKKYSNHYYCSTDKQ